MPWITAILALAVVLLGVAIWSVKRHKDPHLQLDSDKPLGELIPSIAGITLSMSSRGNAVEIVQNGAFFDALLADIAAARHTVHFETFLWKEGALGQRMADAFSAKAREGVQGAPGAGRARHAQDGRRGARRRCSAAGCELALLPSAHAEEHRRAGRARPSQARASSTAAWRGSAATASSTRGWATAQDRQHVRDLSVRLRGPVVHAVQSVFSENWVEVTGKLFVGDDVFPPPERAGEVEAHVASMKPEGSAPAVKILHHTVICCARERLWIQNPYFIPEPDAVEAFGKAARRGVDVRIMVPSTEASDMRDGAARRAPQFPAAARLAAYASSSTTARCCTRR